MAAFGIKAIQPEDNTHILGFATARATADDSLLEIWNGPTNADLVYTLDKEGQHQTAAGTVARPSYSWEDSKTTGEYHIGSDNIGYAVAGVLMYETSVAGIGIQSGYGLVVGHTGQLVTGDPSSPGTAITAEVQVAGTATADATVMITRHSADANAGGITISKSRNAALGSYTVVQDNDYLGHVAFAADDGTDSDTTVARISGRVDDGSPAGSDIGGELIFETGSGGGANDLSAALTLSAAKLATFTGIISVTDATEATSTTAASLKTAGGIAWVKDAYVGDDMFFTSGAILNFDGGDVTLTHSSNKLEVGGGNFHVANTFGLIVGFATQQTVGNITAEVQVLGTTAPDSAVLLGRWSADASEPVLQFYKSRNATIGSNTAVTTGDQLGRIEAVGDDGTDDDTFSSAIVFDTEGTVSTGQVPGIIRFQVAAAGTLADALTINSAKLATFAGAATVTGILTVGTATDAIGGGPPIISGFLGETTSSSGTQLGLAVAFETDAATTGVHEAFLAISVVQATSGTVSHARGIVGTVDVKAAGTTVTNARAIVANGGLTGNSTTTNNVGVYVTGGFNTGGGTITNQYGVYVEDQTGGGSINDAIHVVGGRTFLGGTVAITGDVTLTGALLTNADDSTAIGASGTGFSDIFLASGAVINFAAGDVTLTHAAAKLTWGGDGAVEIDFNNHEMTNVDINSGAIDGTTVGAASASSGAFTTLAASSTLAVTGSAVIGGSAVQDNVDFLLTGSFTGGGTGDAEAMRIRTDLVGAGGDTNILALFMVGNAGGGSITTQTATETVGIIATAHFSDPDITDNLTGDITTAATVYIASAPTEGNGTNAALHVAVGAVIIPCANTVAGTGLMVTTNDTSAQEIMRDSSSARFKEDIEDAEIDVQAVLAINSKRYGRKGQPGSFLGFIVEDFDEAGFGEIIAYDRQGPAGFLEFGRGVTALHHAVLQSHDDRIETNSEKIQRLEYEVRELRRAA